MSHLGVGRKPGLGTVNGTVTTTPSDGPISAEFDGMSRGEDPQKFRTLVWEGKKEVVDEQERSWQVLKDKEYKGLTLK